MFYVAAAVGFLLLAALYFTMKWERQQYEDIDDVMANDGEDDIEEIEDDTEPNSLWKGSIRGTETEIIKGWQREIYVIIEQEFPFNARVESSNPLRSTTRFFKETMSPRLRVSPPDNATRLLAYATETEPMKQILQEWSNPELIAILDRVHHVELDREEFTVQFFHPDIDLDELTDKAKSVVELYEAIPESVFSETDDDSDDLEPKQGDIPEEATT